MKHPAITTCILVGLGAAVGAFYFGYVQSNLAQAFVAFLGILFMLIALYDVQKLG